MTLLSGPNISGNEWQYVKDCLDTGWVSSVGSYVTKFEELMAEYTGTKFAVATSNGTSAIHISLMLAGVERGDYVIAPNLTFVAPLNAITYTGAIPILMDSEEGTWQLDTRLLEEFFEKETYIKSGQCYLSKDHKRVKAILPVHVLGNMCKMEEIMRIAEKFRVVVVEDATEALGSTYNGQHSGSFGVFGTFSFNGNKIITTGGGGMIVTNDEKLAKEAKHLTTQAKADPFEYYHDEVGYNYRLVNVLAAIGVAQMEQLPGFVNKKKEMDNFYRTALAGVGDIRFQEFTAGANPNCWLFTIRTKSQPKLLKALNDANLQSRPFWVPMHRLPMFNQLEYYTKTDVVGQLYQECLSIPCSTNITQEEMNSVVNVIKENI